MKRYPTHWGPFLGQPAGTEVVCDGNVCKVVPVATPAVVVNPPAPGAAPAMAPSDAGAFGGVSLPWLAVGAAAGIGVLLLALK